MSCTAGKVRFDVGAEVRRIRNNARTAQAEVAHAAGMSLRTLQRIEEGTRTATGTEVIRLAQALKVPVNLLFPETVDVSKYSNLVFAGSLYTACVKIDEKTIVPFVVFHVHEYQDWKAFESDAGNLKLWSEFYGIDPKSHINIRPAERSECEVWGAGAAASIAGWEPLDRPAFLVEYPNFEVGLVEAATDEPSA